ncbi:MAG: hypothetical protein NZ534_08655, partial [Bacteroidia bacterium]|nr:hypothetical protein [Bacteroidia bacterium]
MNIRTTITWALALWTTVEGTKAQQTGGAARYESVSPRRVAERLNALRGFARVSIASIGKS